MLEAADWRDLNDYTAGTFVYVAGYAYQSPVVSVVVARRGQHELSYWQKPPPDGPVSMTVVGWKLLPDDGISLYERERWLYGVPDDGAYVRPPEPIYEAGGINARLSPVPRELLIAIAGGAVLRERAFRWTEWSLQRPGSAPARVGERGVNALRKVAFIARDRVLPPGRLPRWHEFDWLIAGAGLN